MSAYRVFVRNLVLRCSIGIYEFEKRMPQRVRITAELVVAEEPDVAGDDLGGVFNYEAVVDGIKAIAGAGHVNLLETLAERIIEFCLEDRRVAAARVVVEKLDVYPDAESVGVMIERWRPLAGGATSAT